jgi:hypothetical protein
MKARVVIETDTAREVIHLRVPAGTAEEQRVRAVLSASVVMGAALLDAEYLVQEESEATHD